MRERELRAQETGERDPKVLGRYRILRRIGDGGMAELYVARPQAPTAGIPTRDFAIKRVLPHLARDPDFLDLFLNEARLAITFQHPNVISVFEVGFENEEHFIVMELLEGADVGRLMRACAGEPAPLEYLLQVAMDTCAGLHYVHEQRGEGGRALEIVHRDVSPQNLFVTRDGITKVLDFGIAKAAGRLAQTAQSSLKGKARYMSPEQCVSDPLDRRSDLFSLSIVLWEMSTGKRLFPAELGDYRVMQAIAERDAPSPASLVPDFPAALASILKKGLARRRDDRFASAEEMRLAFEEFAGRASLRSSSVRLGRWVNALVPARPPSPGPPRRATAPSAEEGEPRDEQRVEGGQHIDAPRGTRRIEKPAQPVAAVQEPLAARPLRRRVASVLAVCLLAGLAVGSVRAWRARQAEPGGIAPTRVVARGTELPPPPALPSPTSTVPAPSALVVARPEPVEEAAPALATSRPAPTVVGAKKRRAATRPRPQARPASQRPWDEFSPQLPPP